MKNFYERLASKMREAVDEAEKANGEAIRDDQQSVIEVSMDHNIPRLKTPAPHVLDELRREKDI
jgi:hypothetical protein